MFLWKFPYGYVKIEVVCKRPERFINEALACGASLHNIERLSSSAFRAIVRSSEFKDVRALAQAEASDLRVLRSGGAAMLFNALLSRKALLLSLLMATAAMFLLSRRILFIDVECADQPQAQNVYSFLEKEGISCGVSAASIDKSELAINLASFDNSIGYAQVSVDGVVLRIRAFHAPNESEDGGKRAASIFANKDCIILALSVFDGKASIKAGDVVKKDQLLVCGDVTPEQGGETVLVHSEAEIIGEVAYAITVRVEPFELSPTRSGNSSEAAAIELFGMKLQAGGDYPDREIEYRAEYPFDAVFLPVLVRGGTAHELVLKNRALTKREMLEAADLKVRRAISIDIPKDALIVSKSTELIWEEDGALTMRATVHTYEKIGYMRYI